MSGASFWRQYQSQCSLAFPFFAGTVGDGTDVLQMERMQNTFRNIANKVVPVVVSIQVNDITGRESMGNIFSRIRNRTTEILASVILERSGMGSGIIVEHKEGKILQFLPISM